MCLKCIIKACKFIQKTQNLSNKHMALSGECLMIEQGPDLI